MHRTILKYYYIRPSTVFAHLLIIIIIIITTTIKRKIRFVTTRAIRIALFIELFKNIVLGTYPCELDGV